jgi:hypothetical protein
MKSALTAVLAIVLISVCPLTRADFKYSEQSKITGGSLMKMTQTLGVFSKSMRQVNQATTTTTMVKGNRMRQESSDGKVQIIDLDGRRFIHIDPATRQYSIVTFDDFKAAMERAEQQAEAQRAQQQAQAQTNPQTQQNPNVKITPKFDAQVTGASRNILGVTANQMKMKMEMLMESTDPQTQGQSGSFLVTSDAWMAPSVPGYDEVRAFQMKMAKELNWLPSTFGHMMGGSMSNPQMGSAMQEFRKNSEKVQGLPLSQVVSLGMASNGASSGQNASNSQSQNPAPQQTSDDNSIPTTKSAAVMKGLGGLFGKKKKQQQDQQQDSSQNSSQSSPSSASSSQSSSLMEVTSEVTSFSSESLDSALFGTPSGYTQVPGNADAVLAGGQR